MFVSTDEKLGVEALLLELPRLPLESLLLVPPDAAGEDDELDEPVLGKLDEPLEVLPEAAGLCALAAPDSANSAAAVAMLTNFTFNIGWIS